MTTEQTAAVERLTASLNEVAAICRNIKADLDELERVDPQAHAALIAALASATVQA